MRGSSHGLGYLEVLFTHSDEMQHDDGDLKINIKRIKDVLCEVSNFFLAV